MALSSSISRPLAYLLFSYITLSTIISLLSISNPFFRTTLVETSLSNSIRLQNENTHFVYVEGHSSKIVDEDFIEESSSLSHRDQRSSSIEKSSASEEMPKPDKNDLNIGNVDFEDESLQPEVYVLFCTS